MRRASQHAAVQEQISFCILLSAVATCVGIGTVGFYLHVYVVAVCPLLVLCLWTLCGLCTSLDSVSPRTPTESRPTDLRAHGGRC